MRVLHILDELRPSGAEVMLRGAATYWSSHGLEADILSTGSIPGAYASALQKSGYQIHYIPFSPSCTFLIELYRFFKEHHYDIVHIHSERGNFWYGLIAYISGNLHIVRTIHNVFCFHGFLRLERYIHRWIMRKIFRTAMISISNSVRDNEWKTFGNHSIIIQNWFDNTKFKPPSTEEKYLAKKDLGISENVTVFTSIGACWPQKNHVSIIEAIALLPESLPVCYMHIGPEMDGYPERKLSQALGASSRICFLGTVMDIVPVLNASDVYIMPSFYEGFSIAAIEAMGVGLPAILANVPGLRDLREVCKDIFWIEPTSNSIRNAILHFLDMDASDRLEIGMNLSACVHNQFPMERGSATYAHLYNKLRDDGPV